MRVVPDARDENLTRATDRIAQAAVGGADIVLLPEALPVGWLAPGTRDAAEPLPDGAVCRALREAAARHRVYVCSGLVERDGDRVFNAAVLVAPTGDVVLHHRKLNELDIAGDLYARGDRLGVADTPWGRVGLLICADAFATGEPYSRALAAMGASLILSPCAWAVPPDHDQSADPYGALWRDCYGRVCREHGLVMAGASNVGTIAAGPWAGHACIGCSLVVDASGAPILEGPYGRDADVVLYVDVHLAAAAR